MSYASRPSHRGRGIFAASGLGRNPNPYETHGLFGLGRVRSPYETHGLFGLLGLGQVKTATTTKTGGATEPDRTASDWASGLTTAGTLVGGIIGAATGRPATTAVEAEIDPATAIAAPVSAGPVWYWPVVIGVGVAVLGGIAYMSYGVKAPVRANRRRSSKRRSTSTHSEWGISFGPPVKKRKPARRLRFVKERLAARDRRRSSKRRSSARRSSKRSSARRVSRRPKRRSSKRRRNSKRRSVRRNYAYQHTSHPGSYDSRGRPQRNSRRRSYPSVYDGSYPVIDIPPQRRNETAAQYQRRVDAAPLISGWGAETPRKRKSKRRVSRNGGWGR